MDVQDCSREVAVHIKANEFKAIRATLESIFENQPFFTPKCHESSEHEGWFHLTGMDIKVDVGVDGSTVWVIHGVADNTEVLGEQPYNMNRVIGNAERFDFVIAHGTISKTAPQNGGPHWIVDIQPMRYYPGAQETRKVCTTLQSAFGFVVQKLLAESKRAEHPWKMYVADAAKAAREVRKTQDEPGIKATWKGQSAGSFSGLGPMFGEPGTGRTFFHAATNNPSDLDPAIRRHLDQQGHDSQPIQDSGRFSLSEKGKNDYRELVKHELFTGTAFIGVALLPSNHSVLGSNLKKLIHAEEQSLSRSQGKVKFGELAEARISFVKINPTDPDSITFLFTFIFSLHKIFRKKGWLRLEHRVVCGLDQFIRVTSAADDMVQITCEIVQNKDRFAGPARTSISFVWPDGKPSLFPENIKMVMEFIAARAAENMTGLVLTL
ncbi:MAG: hypothetical protein ABIH41_02140 [Nanoarchaeota archaeon]